MNKNFKFKILDKNRNILDYLLNVSEISEVVGNIIENSELILVKN